MDLWRQDDVWAESLMWLSKDAGTSGVGATPLSSVQMIVQQIKCNKDDNDEKGFMT